jgi:ankyrin repeat protein
MQSMIFVHGYVSSFCMQEGNTLVFAASQNGHTETLALLLSNKADVKSVDKVQKSRIFKYL